jgi:hypothetical protein
VIVRKHEAGLARNAITFVARLKDVLSQGSRDGGTRELLFRKVCAGNMAE